MRSNNVSRGHQSKSAEGDVSEASVLEITNTIIESDLHTYVVAIAGGTASGKSWLSARLQESLKEVGFETAVLHIDDFALGDAFKGKQNSRYKLDDPDNYRTDEAFFVLSDFLLGHQRPFLAYSLENHKPIYESALSWTATGQSNGRKVVIIEGLYAWKSPLNELVDLKIFLDVNFYHRYVLRLYRNTVMLRIASFEKVTEQYFSFVKHAHLELLEPMKNDADIVLANKFDIGKILSGVGVHSKKSSLNGGRTIYSDEVMTMVFGDNAGEPSIDISTAKGVIFKGLAPDLNIDSYKI